MIASIVFAVLVWVSINMAEEYTLTKHLPVVLENKRGGKALRFPVPKSIMARFRGNGWQLAGLYLSSDVKYFIDESTLGSDPYVVTGKDFFDHVKLPIAVQPLDVKPETLLLALADYKEKRVRIVPRVVMDYHDGFGQVGPVRISPESVLVGGAADQVQAITQWQTVYERYDNRREPISEELGLEEPLNFSLEVSPSSVRIDVDVQPFAEKTITGVLVVASATPLNRDVIFIPPRMDVIVRGGIEQLARLSASDFLASVPYAMLLEDTSGVFGPTLSAPAGVSVLRRSPEKFQFVIRKKL